MITFHPETLGEISSSLQIKELIEALTEFNDTLMIFTMPNADNDSRKIIQCIQEYVSKFPNFLFYKNLGTKNYLSCLKLVDGVVGNSSSGIIEAPSFSIGTVNIGNRQKGRLNEFIKLLRGKLNQKNFFNPKEKKNSMITNVNNLFYRMDLNDKEIRILASIIGTLSKNKKKHN